MENQPISNTSEISSTNPVLANQPPIQPQTAPVNKPSLLIPISITLLVTALIFGLTGYYLGIKSQQLQLTEQVPPTLINEERGEIAIPSPNSIETINKISLSEALSQFCLNSKVSLDKLPFTLDQSIKTVYGVQNSINCFVPEENYASISIRVENPDFSGDVRNIYFFHQNSKYMGQRNSFQSLSDYKTVTINGQNYWLNVIEPGPYGISSLGIWVDLIGEKQNLSSGTIVRVMNLDILKDQQSIDLVKKYGSQSASTDGSTIYVIRDATKKIQFINEVINLASQNNVLKTSDQNISSDLNGVSF